MDKSSKKGGKYLLTKSYKINGEHVKMITSSHIMGGEDKEGSKCKGDDEILTPFKTELGSCAELGN